VAYAHLTELVQGRALWAVPWPRLHEFLTIVTHPRIYAPPTPLAAAVDQFEAWLESPSQTLLTESEGYWPALRTLMQEGRIADPQVHDARVAG
jgi:predicted nucleic acid-binding protein